MNRLLISSAFQRAAKRLSTKGVLTKEVYAEALHLLEQDVFHPRLKTHKLKGNSMGIGPVRLAMTFGLCSAL